MASLTPWGPLVGDWRASQLTMLRVPPMSRQPVTRGAAKRDDLVAELNKEFGAE